MNKFQINTVMHAVVIEIVQGLIRSDCTEPYMK